MDLYTISLIATISVPIIALIALILRIIIGDWSFLQRNPKHKNSKKISETVRVARDKTEIPETYLDWIREHCSYWDVDKLREESKDIFASLPEMYIPLYAYDPNVEPATPYEKAREVDIEDLIVKYEYLLIEGHPASGKTTLLKQVAYKIILEESITGLKNFLPVLIFLKDTKDILNDIAGMPPTATTAQKILSLYFKPEEKGLDIKTIKAYCRKKKAIFLLDGLDEVEPKYRDIIVKSFSEFRIVNKKNKMVFTSRPHGLKGATIDRLGKNYVKILSLNINQIVAFIRKWFSLVSPDSSWTDDMSSNMISEIKIHPATEKLTENPLMLTAICILYKNKKKLPEQRAELYKLFVDCLLDKSFSKPERIFEFLNLLAFKMHDKRMKGAPRILATDTLRIIFEQDDGEKNKDYKKRIESLFDEIEPRCGLLKFDNGEYSFCHLTFQEYFTAVNIKENNTDYEKAIKKYWDDDWYKEVIELYISYLSLENKYYANKIVENIIMVNDKAPFKRWLLASRSFMDIHIKRREEDVKNKTRECMLKIIDTNTEPGILVEAGEILGWLGDTRNLKEFIPVAGGKYKLSIRGKYKMLSKRGVDIKPFEIGKYLVTNSWFEEFISAGGYKNKEYWSEEGKKWLEKEKAEQPEWNESKWKCPNSPVNGVAWYEAYAFTRWLTINLNDGYEYRLPDEMEWKAVAYGIEGRNYIWGNRQYEKKCYMSVAETGRTSPVGIFKRGNTPEGISDLTGNVCQWTASRDGGKFVLHGDSWLRTQSRYGNHYGNEYRSLDDPCVRHRDKGFRCVKNLKL